MKTKNTLSILFALVMIFSNVFNVSASSTAPVDTADKLPENYLAETDDAGWTAYNDCAGTNSIANTTNILGVSGTGTLKNYDTGATLTGVTATFTSSGSPTVGTTGSTTSSGTDAYTTFTATPVKANVVGVVQYGSTSGWYVDFTISGLSSSKTYTFATTANRAGSYTDRITGYTISGVNAATNASTSGAGRSSSEFTEDTTYFNTGNNTTNGYVARWTGIQPGSDGIFKVRASAYTSVNEAYAFSVFMLQEEASTTPTITTSGTLSTFTTRPGVASTAQTYTVAGSNLIADISITAPTGFQISSDGTNYYSSLTLIHSSGSVTTTTIYVQLYNATVGDFSGNITHTSTSAANVDIAVSGTVSNTICTTASLEASDDAYLSSGNTTNNYGTQTYLRTTYSTSSPRGTLIKWDLSSIPTTATVSDASMTVYVSTAASATYYLYNMRQAWVEGSGAGSTTGDGATWLTYDGTNTWGTSGAANTTSDRYDTNLWGAGSTSFSPAGSKTISLNSDGVAAIQEWIADSASNHGVTIQNYGSSGTTYDLQISSAENTTNAGPTLNVSYCVTYGPTITTSGTLTEFSAEPGVASAVQTYSVSGSNLEGDITITAPAGFEISDDGTTYASSLILDETDGVVEDTTIYVRLYSANEGTFSDIIEHTSSGATQVDVAVSGSVLYVYTLIVGNDGNGLVTLSPTGGSYKNGTTVTLIPVPNTGFAFDSWSGANAGDVEGTSVYTIVVDEDKSLDANFIASQTCETVNLEASDDNYLSGANTTNNYGASTTLKVTNNSSGTQRGSLFKWDQSSAGIPSNATVSSASLTLYVSTSSSQAYNLYNMRRTWVEGTGAGSVSGDGATWLTYNGTSTWGISGAASTTADRYDTNLWGAGTTSFFSSGSKTVSFNSSGLAVVQGWISGSTTNYGLTMQSYSSTTGSDDLQFASSENTSYAGPTLNVTYCVGVDSHTLTVGNGGNGTVTLDPTGGIYEHGTVVELTPVPATGYEFATWSGDDASDPVDNGDGAWSITMNEDKSITANFTELPVNVAPDLPVLVQPTDDAIGVSPSPALEVTVSDDNTSDTLDVSFYGRTAGATTAEDFTLIVIPDTQNLAQYYSSVMYSQFQWIANNKTTKNIAFATSVGDIVNTSSSTTQWDVADAAYDYLDAADVAYSVGPGNHDIGGLYSTYFGSSRFLGKSYYQGYYTSGNNNYNNYSFFSASDNDFILINLEYNASSTILNWADQLLKDNDDRRGIVVIHNILNTDNSWQYQTPYTSLKDNPNLFLMLCGHMHTSTDGSAYRAELGDDGQTIHILMTDYQDYNSSSNTGYLRVLRFSPSDDKIYAQVYSPYTGGYLTNASNYETMEMVYDLANGTAGTYELIGTVEDVTNGANASITWDDLEENKEYEWYATVSDGSETVTGSTWSFTTGEGNVAPVVSDIPNQTIAEGSTFATISLDNYVSDVDDTDEEMTWSYSGSADLTVSIVDRIATISTPGTDWNGSETITFRATDPGSLWDEDVASFTVTPVNDAPVITGQSSISTAEDTSLTITLGDLTVTDVDNSYPTGFILTVLAGTNYSFAGNTITPASNFNGSLTVPVKVNDGAADSNIYNLNVTVTPVNDTPVITEGATTNVTMSEDGAPTAFNLTLHVTDADSGDVLSWSILSEANDGTASASGTGEFKQIGYTPDENFNGSDSFVVEVSDGNGGTDIITVNVTIEEVNDPPIAVNDTDNTPEDFILEMYTSYYLGNDLDPDNMTSELIITEVSNPTNGSVVLEGTTVKFTPAQNFFGIGGFDYTLSDGELIDIAHVEVTIIAVNDAPVAVDDEFSTQENTPLELDGEDLTDNDSDVENDPLIVSAVGNESRGTAVLLDGQITFTPETGFVGTAGFEYTLSDGNKTDTGYVTVNISDVFYDLILNINPAGSGSTSPTAGEAHSYASGTVVNVTATANPAYDFAYWEGDVADANSASTTVTMDENHEVTAHFAIKTFTLNYVAGTGGSLTGNISQTVSYGGSGTAVTAVASTGYHFVNWSDGSTSNPRTDTNVTENISVTANFALNTYTINAEAGSGGAINPSGSVSVDYGADQTFSISPVTGYHIADVLVDGSSVGAVSSYTFEDVAANHTIAASFAINTFTITASVGEHGSMTPSGSVSVDYGADQTFSISAASGYHIADVVVDGVSVGAVSSYTFEDVAANHIIATSFAINTYTITTTAGSGGAINPSGLVSVGHGADQTFSISPVTGYHIADVVVDGESVGEVSSYTFEDVAANHTIAASFAINTYTIVASAGTEGAIDPSGSVLVNYGADKTFSISANTGYHIVDVLVDGVSKGAVTTYTFEDVAANHTIAASFAINTYTITATAGSGGAINPSGSVPVNYEEDKTFSITANTGYHIVDVFVDGDSVGEVSSYTFEDVAANHTIAASFAINTYTITASAGSGGAINPSGSVSVDYGADQTFSISPVTGYHIADVVVDGVSVGAVSSYTFEDVAANHTIAASFAINTFTITASAGEHGSMTPSGSVSVDYGADQTFSISPITGYHVEDVVVDGVSVGAVSSYTFEDVATNHTIAASFAINTYTITATAGSGGAINPSGAVSVNYNAGQTFTIAASTGYHIEDVVVDGVSKGAMTSYTFEDVVANHTIAASFAINTFTITASVGEYGSMTPSGSVSVDYGADQTFSISPVTGYHIADVVVDGVSVGAVSSYMFEDVAANHTIAASFTQYEYTLMVVSAHGTVTKSPNQDTYHYGDEVTLSISDVDFGWFFTGWTPELVDNKVTVEGNTTVIANFSQNQPPVIIDGNSTSVTMITTFDLTLNATDPDSETLTWSVKTQANHGIAVVEGTGLSKAISYTPVSGYYGEDSFVVQVADGDGGVDTIQVNVTVIDPAPVVSGIPDQNIQEGETFVAINLDNFVTDPNNTDAEMTWTYSSNDELSVSIEERVATITIPDVDWNGFESITFRATDPEGLFSEDEAVFTVIAVNDAPVLKSIGAKNVAELVLLSFTASATDIDLPANTLTFNLADVASGQVPEGAVINSETGEFTWIPTEAQGAGIYFFDVCVSDGDLSDCETITVTVSEVNVAPLLGVIGNKSVDELVQLSFMATASDVDVPANTLTFSLVGAPSGASIDSISGAFTWTPTEAQGAGEYTFDVCVSDVIVSDCETIKVTVAEVNVAPELGGIGSKSVDELVELTFTATATDADLPANDLAYSLVSAPSGALIDAETGEFSWTPSEAQGPGTYYLNVCVSDGDLGDCETIEVTVNEVSNAPVANGQSVSTPEDTPKAITLTGSDSDGNPITFIVIDEPQHGTLSGAAPNLTYTPDQSYYGDDSFTFKVNDGTLDSELATVSISVTSVNDAPVAVDDYFGANGEEDIPFVIDPADLIANDTDVDNLNSELIVIAVGNPVHGIVVLDGTTISFTPDQDFFGIAEFDYTVSDGVMSDDGHVTIHFEGLNDVPVIAEGESTLVVMTQNGSPVAFNLTLHATDVDGDTLTWSIHTQAGNGAATASGTGASMVIGYTPLEDYTGDDSFIVQVEDGNGGVATIIVNVTINPVEDIYKYMVFLPVLIN